MHFEITKEFIDNLTRIINERDETAAIDVMNGLHAADIAELYDEIDPGQARFLFLLLDTEKAADVLAELEDDDREKFLISIPSDVIARQFIEEMDSDDAADVLADLPHEKKEEVLSHIEDLEQAGDIVDLLNYDEDTAGGLMAKELVSVHEDWTVEESINEVRKMAKDVDEIYFLYVIDKDEKLKGILSIKDLVINPMKSKICDICSPDVKRAYTHDPAEGVANAMHKYDLVSMPVVDSIGRLAGRITIDDVVDFIREEADKDYQMASGISEDVESTDTVWILSRARLPWLLIGMVGGVIGSLVIGYYEGDIMRYAGLALFLPMIAAMAGNVGVQSSAIVVQGLANKTLGKESIPQKLLKELFVGIFNGLICSILVFIYNLFTADSFALTITVSCALITVIIFASVFGTFVPLMLNRFNIDPAVATGPFITTANDIMGLFIYLFLGRFIFSFF
ncbi:MAG: magnesium transporter [Bacteroidota bacterium]